MQKTVGVQCIDGVVDMSVQEDADSHDSEGPQNSVRVSSELLHKVQTELDDPRHAEPNIPMLKQTHGSVDERNDKPWKRSRARG